MKRILFVIILACLSTVLNAQYEPSAINYGVVAVKSFSSIEEVGLGVRIEYAPNCYTTYMGEYNRLFSIGTSDEVEGYNELALGVNLILFNWYPTTITAGFGYIGNDSSAFEEIEDDALIAFTSGDFNHGAQIKLRALHQIAVPVHIFAEFNIKSLGRRYDTFLIGFSYDFDAR
ncbi:hypothetical protein SAMN04487910_3300 [Aquimarina amphilecti]|uniref:Outer membrane protein beta-barrel domain-containing protein n=1 Tax=Aquimarina amphilecti TaxID=1038014 RepID=A0A1H7T689_AQUAM|nr:hypothetical protein [Aquimarina amphilecti]SEL80258.1 hypothetical protein SAMN04487910_3300 [Aquimarina amphilecti]